MNSVGNKRNIGEFGKTVDFEVDSKKGQTVKGLKERRRPHSLVQILGEIWRILAPNEILKETRNL